MRHCALPCSARHAAPWYDAMGQKVPERVPSGTFVPEGTKVPEIPKVPEFTLVPQWNNHTALLKPSGLVPVPWAYLELLE